MRTVALLALSLVACGPALPSPKDVREKEHARREAVRLEKRQREAEETAAIRENHARILGNASAAREQSKADKIEAARLECEAGRPERVQDRERFEKAIERKHELEEWESAHCKWHDRSVPAIRQVQDARGEYHTVEGRSEGIRRECNAPLPNELEHIEASRIFVPQPTVAMGCEKYDAEAQK